MIAVLSRGAAVACAVVGGLALPLGLAPFGLWPLAVVAPALLLAAVWGRSPRAALAFGYLSGVARYGLGVSWVYVSIHEHGHAPVPLAGALTALFVLVLAVFPALTAGAFALARPRRPATAALTFTGLWVLTEWLLGWFLTGFPWLYAGYAHLSSPLAGVAPLAGVLGVSLASTLTGAVLWALIVGGVRARSTGLLTGLVVALWLAAAALGRVTWTGPAGPPVSVALVQGAIPQAIKWRREMREPIIRRHLALSEPYWATADIIVWPEAALTVFARDAEDLLARLDRRGESTNTTLITGIPDYEPSPEGGRGVFQNTAIALGAGSGRYVKQRLVPFGEYVPLESLLRGTIAFFDLPMSRARPGAADQAPLEVANHAAALAICYEIVYPELVRRLARDTGMIVTISNDAWFGDSLGPSQHLQMARMRALELGRPVLRATNDGITALVDADGAELARLPRFEPGVLRGEVVPRAGTTPFAATGAWPVVATAVLLVVAGSGRRRPGGAQAPAGTRRRSSTTRAGTPAALDPPPEPSVPRH